MTRVSRLSSVERQRVLPCLCSVALTEERGGGGKWIILGVSLIQGNMRGGRIEERLSFSSCGMWCCGRRYLNPPPAPSTRFLWALSHLSTVLPSLVSLATWAPLCLESIKQHLSPPFFSVGGPVLRPGGRLQRSSDEDFGIEEGGGGGGRS